MAKFTKQAIVQALLHMLKAKSFDKITVKDICEFCEINRNTFYYYFSDIYDALDTLFEMEAQNVISAVSEGASFYEEYRRSAAIVLNNKEAILHVYESQNGTVLHHYLDVVSFSVVKRFVDERSSGYDLSESDITFITGFYCNAIVGLTMRWIEKGMHDYDDDIAKRISDSFEATILDMIQTCAK